MIDIKLLRQDPVTIAAQLARRGFRMDADWYAAQEAQRKGLQTTLEDLRKQRNEGSRKVGELKVQNPESSELGHQLETLTLLDRKLETAELAFRQASATLEAFHLTLPNLLDPGVPDGADESANQEVRRGGFLPDFGFQPRDHVELGERIQAMDFSAASEMTGARFVVLKGILARLQRALISFMLDLHAGEYGYEEVYVPHLVNRQSLTGTGQLPKFESDLFRVESGADWFLIPTAEVPVTNLARNRVFLKSELPKRWVAHTPCYRSEAGSYGKDLKGMIRQHQFEKVELVQVTVPNDSPSAHERLVEHAESVLKRLELPYRVMLLCAGDTGFASAKTYDLEVWLPSQNRYREISSCSNFRDFQARRLNARWREDPKSKPDWVHTLNGSGLAAGRALLALLENRQDEGGGVSIPPCLRPYLGGIREIRGGSGAGIPGE
jgi:seryl-tRNA synthetase